MLLDANVRLSSTWGRGGINGAVKEQERQPAAESGDSVCYACPPSIASERGARREAILLLTEAGIAISTIAAFGLYSVATVRQWIRREAAYLNQTTAVDVKSPQLPLHGSL